MLQALQHLEERKAEPLKSSQLVEAAKWTGAQGPEPHDKGNGLEPTETHGDADAVPNADKRQGSHSADLQKAEHGGRTTKVCIAEHHLFPSMTCHCQLFESLTMYFHAM